MNARVICIAVTKRPHAATQTVPTFARVKKDTVGMDSVV